MAQNNCRLPLSAARPLRPKAGASPAAGQPDLQIRQAASKYYPSLDGLRAVAILVILLHHMRRSLDLDHWLVSIPDQAFWGWLKAQALRWGWDITPLFLALQDSIWKMKGVLGVEMFFVLSGYLIMRMVFNGGRGEIDCWRFYLRRFLRIYPAYALMVLASLGIFFVQNPAPVGEVLAAGGRYLFFLQNYYLRNPFLEHTWTMVVTEQFYLGCPLLMLVVFALTPSARSRRNILVAVALLFLLVIPGIRIDFLERGRVFCDWPFTAPFPFLTTMYHLEAVVFGCLLALLEPSLIGRRPRPWLGRVLWLAGAGGFAYLSLAFHWDYYYGKWYWYTLGYLSTGFLIMAVWHGVSFLGRWRWLQWIGQRSYGIYLWHYLPLYFWSGWIGRLPLWLIIPAFLLSSLLLGMLSTATLEKFFLSRREKLFPRIPPRSTSAVPAPGQHPAAITLQPEGSV